MRILILALAASSLALSGCGKKEATGNTAADDEGASAEDFATNDVTAIDAATGADANMAADVAIDLANDSGNTADTGSGNRSAPAKARPRGPETSNSSSEPAAPAQQQPAATPPAPPATSNDSGL
jgi:hypothetical protein